MAETRIERPHVTAAVVSLGTPQRLLDALQSLREHETREPFSVVCVVNPAPGMDVDAIRAVLPDATILTPAANVGWAGGLHLARASTDADYMACVQEDMSFWPGWLDAMVQVADADESLAVVGCVGVDADGVPDGHTAGMAEPPDDTYAWGLTDTVAHEVPEQVTPFDWVSSRGTLVRLSAWDAVGGADARLFPLNLVDKDYCTHVRAHGYGVALAPQARVIHAGQQAAPSMFREFLREWREPAFNARWAPVLRELGPLAAREVEHECVPWRGSQPDVLAIARDEASAMLVPFAKYAARDRAALLERYGPTPVTEAELARRVEELERETRELRASASWRVTAPIRWLTGALRRAPE